MTEVEKTIRCAKAQWADLFAVLGHMTPDSNFSCEVAVQVNEILGQTPVVREDLDRGIGHEPFPPDKLKSNPQTVNTLAGETDDVDIKFTIATWVPLQVELIGITMKEGGCGVKEGLRNIAHDMLKIQVAYIEKQGEETMHKPHKDYMFESGDVAWCQLLYRRFWNPLLVISKAVAQGGILVDDDILVDFTLTGNSQYLLLPAVRRVHSAGLVTPALQSTCPFCQLNVSGDMFLVVSENLIAFFHGVQEQSNMLVKLRSHVVHIHDAQKEFHTQDDEVVPLALCRENDLAKLQTGKLASPYDLHGTHPRQDVNHCLDSRQRTQLDFCGLHLVGIVHKTEPKVMNVPQRSSFAGQHWWEGPTNITTVLHVDSSWLVLPYQDLGTPG